MTEPTPPTTEPPKQETEANVSTETEAAPWFDSSGRFVVAMCVAVVVVDLLLALLTKLPAYLLPAVLGIALTLQITALPLTKAQLTKWVLGGTTLIVLVLTVAVAHYSHSTDATAHRDCLQAVRHVPHWEHHQQRQQMRSIGIAICNEVNAGQL